ncbi:hypothetical protein [Erythrobacter sp.]|uniref:hypothetical protein n=1 Tax=Erythrobacter sp. TaxID=1042 RepID=UPI001425EFA5|nr:hypothetical protein [Erythrobacter sp.]QIQ86168.1 MAG: V-type ATPase 116kDa subunit family protein [Erythrobacter sp.]
MREDYIQLLLCNYIRSSQFDQLVGEGWVPEEDLDHIRRNSIINAFDTLDFKEDSQPYLSYFDELFQELVSRGGFKVEGDELSGTWYRLSPAAKNGAVAKILEQNSASKRINNLGGSGPEALRRAIAKIIERGFNDDEINEPLDREVPASDRVVRVSHNQQKIIEEPIEEIVELLEQENSINGQDGLRELAIGRLKAGRELIRAGVFSIQSLQLTLVVGLQMLIEKYKDHAIGAVAGNLLALVLKEFGF